MPVCELLIGIALQIGRAHGIRLVRVQPIKAIVEADPFRSSHSVGFRRRSTIGDPAMFVDVLMRAAARTQDIDRMVARNRHEPGKRTRSAAGEAVGTMPDLDEYLLQRILGLSPVLEDTKGDSEKFRGCTVVEQSEGGPLAQGRPGDQFRDVGVRLRFSLPSAAAGAIALPNTSR